MTRRTQFNGTAATRRREARQHLQVLPVNDFSKELDVAPAKPSRVELTCKRKPVGRVEKSINPINFAYQAQIESAAEFHAALAEKREEKARRQHLKVNNPLGYQMNAHQKNRGRSMPLI